MPDVSVILTTYNQNDALCRSLETWPNQGDIELIISDDGSKESLRDKVEGAGHTYLWQDDNGFRQPSAFARGLDAATGYWVFFSDVECLPEDNLIEAYLDAWQPGMLCLGPRRLRNKSSWVYDERQPSFTRPTLPVDFWAVSASNMFCVTDELRDIGGWNTKYDGKYGLADTDIGARWIASGRRLAYVHDAMVSFDEQRGGKPPVDDEAKQILMGTLCDLGLYSSTPSTPQSATNAF